RRPARAACPRARPPGPSEKAAPAWWPAAQQRSSSHATSLGCRTEYKATGLGGEPAGFDEVFEMRAVAEFPAATEFQGEIYCYCELLAYLVIFAALHYIPRHRRLAGRCVGAFA